MKIKKVLNSISLSLTVIFITNCGGGIAPYTGIDATKNINSSISPINRNNDENLMESFTNPGNTTSTTYNIPAFVSPPLSDNTNKLQPVELKIPITLIVISEQSNPLNTIKPKELPKENINSSTPVSSFNIEGNTDNIEKIKVSEAYKLGFSTGDLAILAFKDPETEKFFVTSISDVIEDKLEFSLNGSINKDNFKVQNEKVNSNDSVIYRLPHDRVIPSYDLKLIMDEFVLKNQLKDGNYPVSFNLFNKSYATVAVEVNDKLVNFMPGSAPSDDIIGTGVDLFSWNWNFFTDEYSLLDSRKGFPKRHFDFEVQCDSILRISSKSKNTRVINIIEFMLSIDKIILSNLIANSLDFKTKKVSDRQLKAFIQELLRLGIDISSDFEFENLTTKLKKPLENPEVFLKLLQAFAVAFLEGDQRTRFLRNINETALIKSIGKTAAKKLLFFLTIGDITSYLTHWSGTFLFLRSNSYIETDLSPKCSSSTPSQSDNKPYFTGASLSSRVTNPDKIYFSGTVNDDKALSQITMMVSGPKGSNVQAFTQNISVTSLNLSDYYFASDDRNYSGIAGNYTVSLLITDSAGQSVSKSFNVQLNEPVVTDNKPSFSSASLASSVTNPDKIYFSGTVNDDKALSEITMMVSGPKGSNITAFTTNISGTSQSLSNYYFDSNNSSYAGVAGNYTVSLWIKDSAGQTMPKTFSVQVNTETIAVNPRTSPVKTFQTGDMIKLRTSGKVYLVEGQLKRHFTGEGAVESNGYYLRNIIGVSEEEFNQFSEGDSIYIKEGTKVQVRGNDAQYLIQDRKKRRIESPQAAVDNGLIYIFQRELDLYPEGEMIRAKERTFPSGALIKRESNRDVYVIDGTTRRYITGETAAKTNNYNLGQLLIVTDSEFNYYSDGNPIWIPDGVVVNLVGTDRMYLIQGRTYRLIESPDAARDNGLLLSSEFQIGQEELNKYTEGERIKARYTPPSVPNDPTPRLLKGSADTYYLVQYGKKRSYLNRRALLCDEYNLSDVITVSDSELNLYPNGAAISEVSYSIKKEKSNEDVFLVVENSGLHGRFKRAFLDEDAFLRIYGFSWSQMQVVPDGSLSSYRNGKIID